MKLSELLSKAGIDAGTDLTGDPDIRSICTDSRRVSTDSLFVCIRGLKRDSHSLIGEAAARGTAAVIVGDGRVRAPDGIAVIYVPDPRAAAARLWDAWYDSPARDLKLIAVTGTNGKTTVSWMLCRIFTQAGYRCGLIGTVLCRTPERELDLSLPDAAMTTPEPELLYRALKKMRDDGAEYVFMEASSHALDQKRLEPLRFAAAVFTNLTRDHLDYHGNMENYFRAKALLTGQSDRVILNADDPWSGRFARCAAERQIPVIRCSAAAQADYTADGIRSDGDGIGYTLCFSGRQIGIRSPVRGEYNVMNSMQALACAGALGIPPETAARALERFPGVPGRMERADPPDLGVTVYIDYAHTPDALEKTLRTARQLTPEGKSLWTVFGCGGERDAEKRPLMGAIAGRLSDRVIVTDDNPRGEDPRGIIAQITAGLTDSSGCAVVLPRREGILFAVTHAEAGDVVVLCGKGHERYEIDSGGKHPFDEREAVLAAAQIRKKTRDSSE